MQKVRLKSYTSAEPSIASYVCEFYISPLSKGRVIIKQIEAAVARAGSNGVVEIALVY